jgi:hypothetical protein
MENLNIQTIADLRQISKSDLQTVRLDQERSKFLFSLFTFFSLFLLSFLHDRNSAQKKVKCFGSIVAASMTASSPRKRFENRLELKSRGVFDSLPL